MSSYGFRDGKIALKKLIVEDKMPVHYSIPYVRASAFGLTNALVRGWDTSAGTTAETNTTMSLQPPYPARLIVYASAAGSAVATQDYLEFRGWNAKGDYVVEDVSVAATAATKHYTNNAFAKLYSVTPDGADHTSTAVNIGWSQIVGLPYALESASDVLNAQKGLNFATTALTYNTTYDTVTLTGLAAGSTFNILYKSKVQDK